MKPDGADGWVVYSRPYWCCNTYLTSFATEPKLAVKCLLPWRHGVSNLHQFQCLFNSYSVEQQQNIKAPHHGNFVKRIYWFPSQMATNPESVFMPWRHNA